MKIGICDESLYYIEQIYKCCYKYEKQYKINIEYFIYNSGEQVLNEGEKLDILFTEIEMKKIDGINLMEKLIKENHVWKIVFVSKNTERIFDIFSIKTLGFVKKPINYESIEKWLNVINNELNKNDIVKYNTGSGKGVISVNKIVYVQGERNCVLVITEDDMFMAMENLKSWEERLVKTDVVRVHKSYLVNMSYISEFGKEIKIQKRKEMIPIGRKYEKNVKQNYNQYISRRF